ncbi:MAG TPA: response regulator [Gemmatimonadaceae bacterium]|nr:response regulator [Gemmatimonadaceae bacterium]
MSAAAPDATPDDIKQSDPGSILVVDDEESFRAVVVRQLNNAGYKTIEARDGSEAIKRFAERRDQITAVLLDMVMPVTSGGDTLQILRYYSPELPVVVTSGYSELEALSLKGTERGVGFLRKPFTAGELTAELRRVISERLPTHRHSTPPKPRV